MYGWRKLLINACLPLQETCLSVRSLPTADLNRKRNTTCEIMMGSGGQLCNVAKSPLKFTNRLSVIYRQQLMNNGATPFLQYKINVKFSTGIPDIRFTIATLFDSHGFL
jgi:hypothetical protein